MATTTIYGQTSIDFTALGRLDANPLFPLGEGKTEYTSGCSSVYSILDAKFGEHLSFQMINHWATTDGNKNPYSATHPLYDHTWISDQCSWFDFLYVNYAIKNWNFRAGKDCIAFGGSEMAEYDWDWDSNMCSFFWNTSSSYQWGGSIGWTNNAENTNIVFQALSSPLLKQPWQRGRGSYTIQHNGNYGAINFCNSISYLQNDTKYGHVMTIIGVKAEVFPQVCLALDYANRYNTETKGNIFSNNYNQLLFTTIYTPSEHLEVKGKIGYESNFSGFFDPEDIEDMDTKNNFFGGITASYFPLKDSKDLRLHASVSANQFYDILSTNIGITYSHRFKLK